MMKIPYVISFDKFLSLLVRAINVIAIFCLLNQTTIKMMGHSIFQRVQRKLRPYLFST